MPVPTLVYLPSPIHAPYTYSRAGVGQAQDVGVGTQWTNPYGQAYIAPPAIPLSHMPSRDLRVYLSSCACLSCANPCVYPYARAFRLFLSPSMYMPMPLPTWGVAEATAAAPAPAPAATPTGFTAPSTSMAPCPG